MKCLLDCILRHPELIPNLGLRRMTGFVIQNFTETGKQSEVPRRLILLPQLDKDLVQQRQSPSVLKDLLGGPCNHGLAIVPRLVIQLLQCNRTLPFTSLDRSCALSLVEQEMLERDEEVRT